MKKILALVLLVVGLVFVFKIAHGDTKETWYVVDKLDPGRSYGRILKTYDENTNIVCYSILFSYGVSISCLKNN